MTLKVFKRSLRFKKIFLLSKHHQLAVPKKKSQEHFKPIVQCAPAQHFKIRVKSEVCLLIFFSHSRVAPNWKHAGTHEINERNPSKSFKFPSSASLLDVSSNGFLLCLEDASKFFCWVHVKVDTFGIHHEVAEERKYEKYLISKSSTSRVCVNYQLRSTSDWVISSATINRYRKWFSDPSVASYKSPLSRFPSPPIANNNSLN